MDPLTVVAILTLLIIPAVGWLLFLRALFATVQSERERRHAAAIKATNERILSERFVGHRSELDRRRQLREWVRLHGNAELVDLRRADTGMGSDGPRAA